MTPITGEPESGRLSGWLFRIYKSVFSPFLHSLSPGRCKFLPTCSEYAYVALARHGVWRGLILALWRLARCHPFSSGGLDPVPSPGGSKAQHLS